IHRTFLYVSAPNESALNLSQICEAMLQNFSFTISKLLDKHNSIAFLLSWKKPPEFSILQAAIKSKNIDIIVKVISSTDTKTLESFKFENGNSILHLAAQFGQFDITNLILEKKFNPNLLNDYDDTALHKATQFGHNKIVNLLLKCGALILPNYLQQTPQH